MAGGRMEEGRLNGWFTTRETVLYNCRFIEDTGNDIFAETSFLAFQGALTVMMHLPAWTSEALSREYGRSSPV